MSNFPEWDQETDTVTADPELQAPSFYHVVLLNDDYTPMDFVVDVLMQFFHKNFIDAQTVMFQVHYQGRAVAGTYPHEIAETKANQVIDFARKSGYPLQCVIRPQ